MTNAYMCVLRSLSNARSNSSTAHHWHSLPTYSASYGANTRERKRSQTTRQTTTCTIVPSNETQPTDCPVYLFFVSQRGKRRYKKNQLSLPFADQSLFVSNQRKGRATSFRVDIISLVQLCHVAATDL